MPDRSDSLIETGDNAMSGPTVIVEVVRGFLANRSRERARGQRAYLGTIGHKEIICHHAMLIRRDDDERRPFPLLAHVQPNGLAFAPHDQSILPGDEIRWIEKKVEHAAWVLEMNQHRAGHKMGGSQPLPWSIPDHKPYLSLIVTFAPPETRTSWTTTVGPIINAVVVFNLSVEAGLDSTSSALLRELLRRVNELLVATESAQIRQDDLTRALELLQEALRSSERTRIKQALALLGGIGVGATGSGTWEGIRALIEALTRRL